MQKNALLIFVRNPVYGKVKTRLANTLGHRSALKIYLFLLNHTQIISQKTNAAIYVFYSDFIGENDLWNGYTKILQEGRDLGERMQHAFWLMFEKGYENVCIIGSDCYHLNAEILQNAFEQLKDKDAVVGPATDGGYYLLGIKKLHTSLFERMAWGSQTVLSATLAKLNELGLYYMLLPVLNDVDEAADVDFDWQTF
jgi:rSAM/selenodomain-associated transferase 1